MGVWQLDNRVLNNDPDWVELLLNWMKRECKAEVIGVKREPDVTKYWIEGEGIPVKDKWFSIYAVEIAKQVYILEIVPK